MDGHKKKLLVVGLPRTGKTTFLAALWDVVGSGEVAGSMKLERLSGDQQHLNDLRDLWADCHEVPRTRTANERVVSMTLRETRTNITSEIVFSDMSGESFERQWTERVWTPEYEAHVQDAAGVLLFIHPHKVREPALIRDARCLMQRIQGVTAQQEKDRGTEDDKGEQTVPAEPRFAATQVQLVELLQFIDRRRPKKEGFRVAVVISAWDLVLKVEKRKTPEAWLAERLPLLEQYLRAHSDEIPFRIYGVSAQGGDIEEEAERLRTSHRASDRIIVAHGKEQSPDITAPVRWAMGIPGE